MSKGPVFEAGETRQAIRFALHMQSAIGSREKMCEAWEELRKLVRARSVMHIRHNRGSRDAFSASRNDPSAGKLFARPPRSYASVVLGKNLHAAKPGTVWMLSEAPIDNADRRRLKHAGTAEIAVIALQNEPGYSDFIELEFEHEVSAREILLLETLGQAVAEAWRGRKPGTVNGMLRGRASRVAREVSPDEATPILDAENPAGLTRAEFFVCVLITEGKLLDEIARALTFKKTTVRSHLRSIYAKTGVSGQVELVHRLHGRLPAETARAV